MLATYSLLYFNIICDLCLVGVFFRRQFTTSRINRGALYSKNVLALFGADYIRLSPYLIILIIAASVKALPSFCYFGALYSGYEHVLNYATLIAIVIAILICSPAYYLFGLPGMIWSMAIVKIIREYGLFFYTKTRCSLKYMRWL